MFFSQAFSPTEDAYVKQNVLLAFFWVGFYNWLKISISKSGLKSYGKQN